MSSSIKHYGRIYTPDYLVKRMLDFGNYRFGATQCRHVIDNSCGNGAFLTEIVRRYIVEFLERSNDLKLLQSELETFVHGVEIDRDEYAKCLHNLDKTAAEYGLSNVRWDIINADTLTLRQFDNKMDFVFGNPPYVRVHNLSDNYNSVKMYEFAEKGMTDLFIVFFEIGFNMLSEQGTMVLITPSSWLSSKAGGKLRNYIMRKNNLSGVIDLGHFQPFNAATYTLISRFQPTETFDKIDYYTFDSNELKEAFINRIVKFMNSIYTYNENPGKYSLLSIDGQEFKGSGRSINSKNPQGNIATLNIFDASSYVCLYSEPISKKESEITSARNILTYLDLSKKIIIQACMGLLHLAQTAEKHCYYKNNNYFSYLRQYYYKFYFYL